MTEMRWFYGITDSMDMSLSTNILAWRIPWTDATVHGDNKESDMNE